MMKKLIALSVLTSVILTGCGSSSGGGSKSGGSTAPTTPTYELQFVKLKERDKGTVDSKNCTLFDVAGQTNGKETYAQFVTDVISDKDNSGVTVKTYDANGDFVKDLSSLITSTGILNITENDVADGGYVSIIDSPSSEDKYYKVLSIQKALLGNFIIEVNRPQNGDSCYTGKKAATVKSGYASVDPNGTVASTYSFASSKSNEPAIGQTSQVVSAYSDENVLSRAYLGGNLVDYAFVSKLTTLKSETPTTLSLAGATIDSYAWGISLPANELTKLSVRLNQGDYSYPWIDATFVASTGVTTNFSYVNTETSWGYSAEGKTTLNWNFMHNDTLSATLDVLLPTVFTLSDDNPAINNVAGDYAFQAQGIDSTLTRLQRSSYQLAPDASNTLNHVIYSEVASNTDVVIPKLGLSSLDDPTSASNLTINVLSADTLTDDLRAFFMYENAASDSVSTVLSPADTVANNKVKYTNTYTLLSR